MGLKLSIFTTVTRPFARGDNMMDALRCYADLADELIVIDGSPFGSQLSPELLSPEFMERHGIVTKHTAIDYSEWPKEFEWPLIGQQFQKGYEAASGDWVIHADLDFVFHERDFDTIRKACEDNPDAPALSFWKYQFILPDRYNLKSRLVLAVNQKKYGDRIRFDSGGDLCQPSLDGKYIEPGTVPEARVPFYNYEKMTKTKTQAMDDVGRMDRAWHRLHNEYIYGNDGTDESAFAGWMGMVAGRFKKPQKHIRLSEHPKYVQETVKNLGPEQFGYSGLGELEVNDYAKEK